MKFIHLPVQSGSDEILRLMNRRYNSKEYLILIDRIRSKIPNIEFSTDIIVGFPNETYDQFKETIDLVQKVHYTSAFTFIYSPREGTPAARLNDNVTYEEKVKRFKEPTTIYENSNLTGKRYGYRANTSVRIMKNISGGVDKIAVIQTGRTGYVRTNCYK